MSSIAIITARGGSKRIPKKNIREFCGKPILAYSIEAALKSGCFDEVMVSTDSVEIADIAREYGAAVPFFRSGDTSGDFASTADVLKEVLEEYNKLGKLFDIFCCIYPTAPLITEKLLREAIEHMVLMNADSLIPVVRYGYPPQRGFIIRDGCVEYKEPQNEWVRSQDLEPEYHDAGAFYICRVDRFEESGSLVVPQTVPLVLEEIDVQDIDNMTDWHLAELKYVYQKYRDKFEERGIINQMINVIKD